MKKAQVIQNSTASSEWISTINVNELGISYDQILSEQNLDENDDESHNEFGRIQYEDFQLMPGSQQVDIFTLILKKDYEESQWNQTSQLHFGQEEQYFSSNHQLNFHHVNPTQKPEREQNQPNEENVRHKKEKMQSVSSQTYEKGNRNMQAKNLQKKFKKNVNVPKAIGRYLMDYHHLFQKNLFQHEPYYYQQLSKELQDLKTWVRKSKKNSFKLTHLDHFFSSLEQTKKHSSLNRLMMRKILQRSLREEIIPNNQVKDKLEYLVASKVFSLRCANSKLSTRMQMH